MSEIKHTPGPWRINNDRHEGLADDEYHFIEAGDGLCSPPKYNGFEISGCMTIHDARLIAAAPELLEALQLCYDHCRLYLPEVEHNNVGETVRAVIAKALGEQS